MRATPPDGLKTRQSYILPGDPPIEVALRRSPRARRFSLRVSRSDGRVGLSMPSWSDSAEAIAFLQSREDWLRRQLARTPPPLRPEIGARMPLEGALRPIVAGTGRSARFENGALAVPPDKPAGPLLRALLRQIARDRLEAAATRHATTLGRGFGKITLRDTRSRWGSCTSRGDLMFSWRLIMAPPEVLDYVAAHEVAHLEEMNHSARYWRVCARLCPDYQRHRDWLRREGPALMAWLFDDLPDSGNS